MVHLNGCVPKQIEDLKNGRLGFGGSSPVIQVAGAQRVLEQEPRMMIESGNYTTQIPMMFGANKNEGVLVLACKFCCRP